MKVNHITGRVMVTQSMADFGFKLGDNGELLKLDGSKVKRNPAFTDWTRKLKKGESLPRGRFFKNKKPGKPLFITDEFNYL